jgi:hypothetical protein
MIVRRKKVTEPVIMKEIIMTHVLLTFGTWIRLNGGTNDLNIDCMRAFV